MMRRASRSRAGLCVALGAVFVLQTLAPAASLAAEAEEGEARRQAGEDRWVASFAISSGVNVQKQKGSAESFLFEDGTPPPVPLQEAVRDHDVTLSPFVGGTLELMSPALDIPTRPRFFVSGGILPSFGTERTLAVEGDPGCIRGPEPNAPCTADETEVRTVSFGESAANGQGSKTQSEIDTLVYTASFGVAFPLQLGKRQLRIKPSLGWTHYKITGKGLVSDAECQPQSQCTDREIVAGVVLPGFLREATLIGKKSRRFNGIGPGIDVELDAARYGPLGVSLFAGAHAYYILGDRNWNFGATEDFNDPVGTDTAEANFRVGVNEWFYRGQVGIRFSWLGQD